VQAYRKAVDASPEWVEARINLGTAFYQLGRLDEARDEFAKARELDPESALAEFNLGCVLDQLGQPEASIQALLRAVAIAPGLADAHLNLALAFERGGHVQSALRHLSLYLRYDPNGPWAEFARSRMDRHKSSGSVPVSNKVTPFRRG
jgi:tetratricopeptide (TPR) repeat protein